MSEALSKLVEFLLTCWRALVFWTILDQEAVGFIRRLGRHSRDAVPGLNWKWPIIERLCSTEACEYTLVCDPQSLTTKDGVALVLRVTATCCVVNARTYFLNAQDGKSNVQDLISGTVGWLVPRRPSQDVLTGRFLAELSTRAGKVAGRWGIHIESVSLMDCARARSIRVWQNQITSAGQE